MEQKMMTEMDIKKLVGEVMKEGLTYTAKHTNEMKEENEDLKAQIAALKQDMEEVQHENSNMRALIHTSLNAQNYADLQDDIEGLKEQQQLASAANLAKEVAYKHTIEKLKKDNKHLTDLSGRQGELIDTLKKSVKEANLLTETYKKKYNELEAAIPSKKDMKDIRKMKMMEKQYDWFVKKTIECWDWDLGTEDDSTFGSNWGSMYITDADADEYSTAQVRDYFENIKNGGEIK